MTQSCLPNGATAVDVAVMDSTTRMSIPASHLLPPTPGLDKVALDIPSYSFLIRHPSGRALLFDLGLRKDYWKITGSRAPPGWTIEASKNVGEILQENGVPLASIEAVIWSHHHADHVGDMTILPPSTKILVGPGFKEQYLSSSAASMSKTPDMLLLEENLKGGRKLVEVSFEQNGGAALQLGPSRAYDYFGDGSFYILDSPGHTHGHLAALARVTPDPQNGAGNSFILMAGDTCHFPGQFRPAVGRPFPHDYSATGYSGLGALVHRLIEQTKGTESLFGMDERNVVDMGLAEESTRKLQMFDALDNVWVIVAHDRALLGRVEFFPASLNDWKHRGYADKVRWGFLEALECSESAPTNGDSNS